ncbi:oxygenase MpaB family protein [Rhodococcus sp. NPDC054953]
MTSAPPTRHPDAPCTVPPGIRMFGLMLGLRRPDAAEFRRMGDCLTVGDAPADRLVEWMYAAGMSAARPLFERALSEGIGAIEDAPEPLRAFFSGVEAVPDWVDWPTIELGAAVMRSGGADGLYIARDVALLGGYMFAGFNQTLLRTGALEKGSNARFAETSQWALDVIGEDGLRPGGAGYRSTLRVRLIHAMVRRHVAALPDWDPGAWGLPINQTDMAATVVGALVAPSMGAIAMGTVYRPTEYDAVAHLTRYVGWLIGVQDEFLPTGFRDAVRVLLHTSYALSTPDETTRQLAVPMIDDPLSWNYRVLPALRRRIARSQHLSVTSAFLGPGAMRTLGLPALALPWYPLIRFPLNAFRSVLALRRGGRDRAAARGAAQQRAFMRTMVDGDATVGHAATGITHRAA